LERILVIREVLLIVAVCAGWGMSVAGESAHDILEKVKKKYDSIVDAQLTFSQKTSHEMATGEQLVKGVLFIKKENKYRVEFEGQTIVTNGETVWSFSPSTNQVLIDKFKLDERSYTPERILTGAPSDFSSTVVGREKIGKVETIVLKLVPRNDQGFVTAMRLWVDDKEWLIKKVEMSDANGKQTEYLVTDIRTNIGLQDSRFTYQVPEGVEVVDLR
jgi:outer membrane lipoprotein carrier protein